MLRRAFALGRTQRRSEAEKSFHKAIELATKGEAASLMAEGHRGLGELFMRESRYDVAGTELQAARKLFEAQNDVHGLARVDHELGRRAYFNSDQKQAVSLYEQSIVEFQAAGDERGELNVTLDKAFLHPAGADKTSLLHRLGVRAEKLGDDVNLARALHWEGDDLFNGGDYSGALTKYQQALKPAERSSEKEQLATLLVSMGRLLRAQGHAEAALPYYRRALAIQRARHDDEGTVLVLNAMAVAYDRMEQYSRSVALYRQAWQLARRAKSPRYERFELGNLAGVYELIGDCQRALPLLKQVIATEDSQYLLAYRYQALARCQHHLGQFAPGLESVNRSIELRKEGKNQEGLMDGLMLRARIFSGLHDIRAATADSERALSILEDTRQHLAPNDFLKRGFLDYSQENYAVSITLRVQEGDFAKAVEITEQGRARAFLDLLATREKSPGGSVKLPSSHETESSTTNPKAIASNSTVFAQSFTSAQMIEASKRLNSTIVSYWCDDDELFVFVISPSGTISGKELHIGKRRLSALVAQTRDEQSSKTQAKPGTADPWRTLYSLLISPIQSELPTKQGSLLTIVPHGPLFELAFEALRDGRSHYLLERYAIHYLPAVSVLEYTERNGQAAHELPKKSLLVSETFSGRSSRLAHLPAAAAEIKAIRVVVGPPVTVEDSDIKLESLAQEVSDATLVHFATHAVFDNNSPLASYLLIGKDPNASEDRLTAQQIYELKIAADLVVLSACETARGKVTGDGVNGMTRAFFAAGAASVLASVWDVPDTPTDQLMVTFYRGMQRGLTKSEALRQAQLALIGKLRARKMTVVNAAGTFVVPENPHLWAGFVLEGNP